MILRSAFLLLASCFLTLCALGHGQAATAVGWIDEIQGNVSHFTLLRGGEPQAVSLFAPVFPGDVLQVEGGDSLLVLGTGRDGYVEVTAEESPYTVAVQGQAPTLSENLLAWAGGGFADLERTAAATVSASSRSYGEHADLCPDLDRVDYLSAPLLKGGPLALEAGQRSLAISWRGGYGPYTVRLERNLDHKVLLEASDVRTTEFSAQPLNLEPGLYSLAIEDIGGLSVRAELHVREPGSLPSLPLEYADSAMPPCTLTMLHAAWLAANGDGQWRFEAYQMLAGSTGYQPAELLRSAMECGFTFALPPGGADAN